MDAPLDGIFIAYLLIFCTLWIWLFVWFDDEDDDDEEK